MQEDGDVQYRRPARVLDADVGGSRTPAEGLKSACMPAGNYLVFNGSAGITALACDAVWQPLQYRCEARQCRLRCRRVEKDEVVSRCKQALMIDTAPSS